MKKVILGATGSIGSSLAKKLIESGDQVHLVGRDEASISSLANELNSSYTTCDVLEENFSDKILSDLGIIHYLLLLCSTVALIFIALYSDFCWQIPRQQIRS